LGDPEDSRRSSVGFFWGFLWRNFLVLYGDMLYVHFDGEE
jgi:hypothetical protein